ncbi:MAG: nitroreductase [Bacteroidota bacterium]
MNFEALSEVIRQRRMIGPPMYLDKPISDETILKILENANWAPTHKRTEPWRFKIFKGDRLKDLSDYLSTYYKENTPEEKYSEMKYQKTLKKPLSSACVIAICMYLDPNVSIPEWEEVAAVSCAVQNMWLSCTALGIGSYWSSPKSIIEARSFLGLEEHEKCLGLFYMGYVDDLDIKGKRTPIEDKIEWM